MIILELPIIFCKNYDAIEKAKEQGIELPDRDEYTTNCTFFIPEATYIRVTETEGKATILLDCNVNGEIFQIDAVYETAINIVKNAVKKLITE